MTKLKFHRSVTEKETLGNCILVGFCWRDIKPVPVPRCLSSVENTPNYRADFDVYPITSHPGRRQCHGNPSTVLWSPTLTDKSTDYTFHRSKHFFPARIQSCCHFLFLPLRWRQHINSGYINSRVCLRIISDEASGTMLKPSQVVHTDNQRLIKGKTWINKWWNKCGGAGHEQITHHFDENGLNISSS